MVGLRPFKHCIFVYQPPKLAQLAQAVYLDLQDLIWVLVCRCATHGEALRRTSLIIDPVSTGLVDPFFELLIKALDQMLNLEYLSFNSNCTSLVSASYLLLPMHRLKTLHVSAAAGLGFPNTFCDHPSLEDISIRSTKETEELQDDLPWLPKGKHLTFSKSYI